MRELEGTECLLLLRDAATGNRVFCLCIIEFNIRTVPFRSRKNMAQNLVTSSIRMQTALSPRGRNFPIFLTIVVLPGYLLSFSI